MTTPGRDEILASIVGASSCKETDHSTFQAELLFSLDTADLARRLASSSGSRRISTALAAEIRALGRSYDLYVGNSLLLATRLQMGRRADRVTGKVPDALLGAVSSGRMLHSVRRLVDSRAYLGFGAESDQFAPDLLSRVDHAIRGVEPEDASSLGTPLFRAAGLRAQPGRDGMAWSSGAPDFSVLRDRQVEIRQRPLSDELEARLSRFFSAPMTIGIRDVMRYVLGSRHPGAGWALARSVILDCGARHASENFVLPELLYYSLDSFASKGRLDSARRYNATVVSALVPCLMGQFGAELRQKLDREKAKVLIDAALACYHEAGAGSRVRATFLAASGQRTAEPFYFMEGRVGPDAWLTCLSIHRPELLGLMDHLGTADLMNLRSAVLKVLVDYRRHRGVKDGLGKRLRYRRLPWNSYRFVQRPPGERKGAVLEASFTLDRLWFGGQRHYLETVPELSEKLLLFFLLVYREMLETGHMLDLSPRNKLKDLVFLGYWGHLSDKVRIQIWRDPAGVRSASVFVSKVTDDPTLSLLTTPLRLLPRTSVDLARSLVESGLQRSIGLMVSLVLASRGEPLASAHIPVSRKAVDLLPHLTRTAVLGGLETFRNVAADSTRGVLSLLRSFAGADDAEDVVKEEE